MNRFTVKNLQHNVRGIGEFQHHEKVICYLIVGDKEALLFDTGMGVCSLHPIIQSITSLPVKVVNSHHHFDHVGSNREFNSIYCFDHPDMVDAQKGVGQSILAPYSHRELFYQIPSGFDTEQYVTKPFTIAGLLQADDIIDLAPFIFRVLHTPGHSSDSICLYEEKMGWLFCADLIYPGPIFINDEKKYVETMSYISSLPIKKLFPGHNDFTQDPSVINRIIRALGKPILDKSIQIDSSTSIVMV